MEGVGKVRALWRYPVKSTRGERLEQAQVGLKGLAGDRGWAVRDDTVGEVRGGRHLPRLLQCSSRYESEPAKEPWPAPWITMPSGTGFQADDPRANGLLSKWLGRPVSLWPIVPPDQGEHYRRLPLTEAELREQFARQPDEPLPDMRIFPQELMEYVAFPGTYFDVLPIHLLTSASLEHMRSVNPASDWSVARFRPNIVLDTGTTKGLLEADWTGRTVRIGEVELSVYSPAPRCAITVHLQGEDVPKDPAILRSIVRHADQNLGVYCRVTKPGVIKVGDAVGIQGAAPP